MTKSQTALTSLVAAVPGGFLAYLLVMAFLGHADQMGGMLNGVVGVALLCSIAAALTPVGIMLFGGPRTAKPKAKKKADDDDAGDSVVGLEEVDEFESASGVSDAYADSDDSDELLDDFGSSDLLDGGESDESGEMMDAYDDEQTGRREVSDEWDVPDSDLSDEFEFDDALSDDEMDFDFEDEEK